MPVISKKCIESWIKFLPDYKLLLWDEQTFDIQSVPYVDEAYKAKKFAFVSDYVRLYALYHHGGIYMDTDVEVIKSLDDLLHLPGFSGFESEMHVPTGIIACEQNNDWAREQMDWYIGKHFIRTDGTPDLTSNVVIISRLMSDNGFILNNSYQVYKNCMYFFPKEFFCPKSHTGIVTLTTETYCIHHFAASWHPWPMKLKKFFFHSVLGTGITDILVSIKRKLAGIQIRK